jgi:hypothetical protein
MANAFSPLPSPGRYGVCARLEQQEVLPREALIGDGFPANRAPST